MNEYYKLISSSQSFSPFAPKWNCHFYNKKIEDPFLLSEIEKYLISERDNIIKKYPNTLYNGGFELSDLNSRYLEYNLFQHAHDIGCIINLKDIIKDYFYEFLKCVNYFQEDPYYISCWYTCLNPGESLQPHFHDNCHTSFFSGNLIISCEQSETIYEVPYRQGTYSVVNKPGLLTFFESHLFHWTSSHIGSNPRLSIAFDIKQNLSYCPKEGEHRFVLL